MRHTFKNVSAAKSDCALQPQRPHRERSRRTAHYAAVMGRVAAAAAIVAFAGWTITWYKFSHVYSNGCLFFTLVLQVYLCFTSDALLTESAEAIQRGDELASLGLVGGVVVTLVGVLPPLLFSLPYFSALRSTLFGNCRSCCR